MVSFQVLGPLGSARASSFPHYQGCRICTFIRVAIVRLKSA